MEQTTPFCRECGWCCKYLNVPVPTNEYFTLDKMLELLWTQGHKLYWEPMDKNWYILTYSPCEKFYNYSNVCTIYSNRPELCKEWICDYPGRMHRRYDNLVEAGQKILENKFRGKKW